MANDPSKREILWRQYALYADLYKFYIDIVIKYNVFHYAITGGILSFYFTRSSNVALAKWSLALPLVLSVGAAAVLFYGASLLNIFRDEMFCIRDELELDSAPDFQVVTVILGIFAVVQVFTAIGMTVLLVVAV